MNVSRLISFVFASVFTLFLVFTSQAAEIPIPAGNDYLLTTAGTFTTIPGIGVVNLMGNPTACGSPCLNGSDTVITRSTEVPGPMQDTPGQLEGTINAMLTQLFLRSTAPVNIGGSFFDIFVTLDTTAGPSTGQLVLMNTNGEGTPTTPEGTFAPSSFFDFFVDIKCAPAGSNTTPLPCNPNAPSTEIRLTTLGGGWNDIDDGAAGFVNSVNECNPGVTCHVAVTNPEPNSGVLVMAVLGICFSAFRKRRIRTRR
jgi:hypothetical protein